MQDPQRSRDVHRFLHQFGRGEQDPDVGTRRADLIGCGRCPQAPAHQIPGGRFRLPGLAAGQRQPHPPARSVGAQRLDVGGEPADLGAHDRVAAAVPTDEPDRREEQRQDVEGKEPDP